MIRARTIVSIAAIALLLGDGAFALLLTATATPRPATLTIGGDVPRLPRRPPRVKRFEPGRPCIRNRDDAALDPRPSPSFVGHLDGATGTRGAPRQTDHPVRSTSAVGRRDPDDARGRSRPPDPGGSGPMDDLERIGAHRAERGCRRLELLPRCRAQLDGPIPGWLELRDRRMGA